MRPLPLQVRLVNGPLAPGPASNSVTVGKFTVRAGAARVGPGERTAGAWTRIEQGARREVHRQAGCLPRLGFVAQLVPARAADGDVRPVEPPRQVEVRHDVAVQLLRVVGAIPDQV